MARPRLQGARQDGAERRRLRGGAAQACCQAGGRLCGQTLGALTPSRTHPGPRLEGQPPARRWLAWRGMRLVYLSLLSGHLTQMPPRGPVA